MQAVIFDMDGVLVDSEPLWRRAQLEIFQPLGVPIEEKHTIATTGVRIDVIVENYFRQYPWEGPTTAAQCFFLSCNGSTKFSAARKDLFIRNCSYLTGKTTLPDQRK